MADTNNYVHVLIIEDTTVEVLSIERGGTEFFVWRTVKDGQIAFTSPSVYADSFEALDAGVKYVLPDVGIKEIEEPSDEDFEMLNMMLGFSSPEGKIESLFDALKWHDLLYSSLERLVAAERAADLMWEKIMDKFAEDTECLADDYSALFEMRKISEEQFKLSKHFADRDLDVLSSFLENFLGKRG